MRNVVAAATLGVCALTGFAVAAAAPASAGCDYQLFAQYCDGPIQPDGTFERCQTTYAQSMFGGPQGGFNGFVPGTYRCYPINPAEPWPALPLGQPQYHLWP